MGGGIGKTVDRELNEEAVNIICTMKTWGVWMGKERKIRDLREV
jgi:hypothetical protein